MSRTRRRLIGAATAALIAAPLVATTPATAGPTTNPDAVRTDRVEAVVDWTECPPSPMPEFFENAPGVECATVALPLDYDEPNGATVDVFVAKHPAADQENRIGSLFVNPGGPGGPGSILALAAPLFYTPDILDRFDIIGMDPRGIGSSTQVICHTSIKKQTQDLRGLRWTIPLAANEQAAVLNASKKQAMACSSTGEPLSASMSTAEVARDMDVLRRVLGDEQLTYAGTSYGSYLGQVYANMFPDRVRAVLIDGVLDPIAWAGTAANAHEPVTLRLQSGEGAWGALQASFALCDAEPSPCLSGPQPQLLFDEVVARLKVKPVQSIDPLTGEPMLLDYGSFISSVLMVMYAPNAPGLVDLLLVMADAETNPAATAAQRFAAREQVKAAQPDKIPPHVMEGYDNSADGFWSVLCSDSINPTAPKDWAPAIAKREAGAPHFAALWGWQSATCAERFWTADGEDSWRGPFTNQTSAPVLIVGNWYDPATPYTGAQVAASLLPNSALLTVEGFGHGAYMANQCATEAMDDYIINLRMPLVTTCANDQDLFPSFG